MNMNYRIENIFPTPIYVSTVSNFDSIQKEIENGISSSNFEMNKDWGNTHYLSDISFKENAIKDKKMFYFEEEIDRHIKNYCLEIGFCYKKYEMESWISLFKEDNYGHIHSHGHSDISGCYYYKSSPDSGEIFFENPVANMSSAYCYYQKYCQRWIHQPDVGKILLFPGWLKHGITKNNTKEERISISFNINFRRD